MELYELHQNTTPPPIKRNKRPRGIYVLAFWFTYSLFSMFLTVLNPKLMIGGIIITGLPVLFYNFSIMLVIVFKVYGMLTRKKFSYYIIIGHEIYKILFTVMGVILFYLNKEKSIEAIEYLTKDAVNILGPRFYDLIMVFMLLFVITISSLIIFYVIKRKNYFTE